MTKLIELLFITEILAIWYNNNTMTNVKLTTPIETIELDKEIQKECVMYDACLFDSTPKNFYTCSHCQKIGDKICEKCFINCHQHGNPKKKKSYLNLKPNS